jgi:hypothetical protein
MLANRAFQGRVATPVMTPVTHAIDSLQAGVKREIKGQQR